MRSNGGLVVPFGRNRRAELRYIDRLAGALLERGAESGDQWAERPGLRLRELARVPCKLLGLEDEITDRGLSVLVQGA
jgi:hypothetical protein